MSDGAGTAGPPGDDWSLAHVSLRWLIVTAALALGLWGLGAWLGDLRVALWAYLVGFVYWAGIVLAALLLLMIWHASHSRWVVVLRRPLEALAAAAPVLLLLFVPVALGMRQLYLWVAPPGDLGHEALEWLHHKRGYLNVPFFLLRTLLYLGLASLIAGRLFNWSVAQDHADPGAARAYTLRQRRLGTGALPLMALVIAFAAFDWVMSLTPLWYSTIFGVYYFSGSVAAVIALLILAVTLGRRGPLGRVVNREHLHNLGKFLLTFTCFWAYIAFSQLMLIWLANLPEEVPFYAVRLHGEWRAVSFALAFVRFVLPFFALLSRDLKRRPRALALVAGWVLFANLLDVYWLIIPALSPRDVTVPLTVLPAVVGVGAVVVGTALWRVRHRALVPVGDPYLPDSLRYRQP